MQTLNLFDMTNFSEYDFNELEANNSLANERPIGWSSTCLDQTISYYIDCNINVTENKEAEN